jgi:tRNA G18 (ribose-2'-O)-methylase SpoU
MGESGPGPPSGLYRLAWGVYFSASYDASVGIIRIDNEDDDRLSEFRNVPDAELLTRLGLFVAEGRLVVARLLASELTTRAVLVTEPALVSLPEGLTDLSVPIYVVPQSVMNDVGSFNFHRGCLALGVRPPARDWREIVVAATTKGSLTPARLVVLERVGNMDNVGSIFRNAAAFGVDGVLLQADCADPLYRKAIRTSMAASLVVPYATAPWPDSLCELARGGWATVAMTPAGEAPLLRDVAATLTNCHVAIVLGHEGEGLTDAAISACTHRARIAMSNGVDSVNVATAAAIALYVMGSGVI